MELRDGDLVLEPVAEGHVAALRAIREREEVARWWGALEDDFPLGDEPTTTRFAVLVGDAVVGLVQFGEEEEPMYRYAWIDVFLDPDVHGRGVGRRAVRLLADHLLTARGHHRITIDPAADNVAAVRAYTAAGFEPVGVLRLAERDPVSGRWRDSLLMERVVDPDAGGAASGP